MLKKTYATIKTDSLYRNSTFLLVNNVVLAGLGFVFWGISTKLYSPEDIGLATTLISVVELISVFALLGFNTTIVRYLANAKDKNHIINTTFTVTSLSSIIGTLIFLIGIHFFSPELAFVTQNLLFAAAVVVFVLFTTLSVSIKSIFRANRSSEYVVIKNIIFNVLKLFLTFALVALGAFGLLSAWMASLSIAFLISFGILIKRFGYVFKPGINKELLREVGSFSLSNYVASFLSRIPQLSLPILITHLIGPEHTAFYYIDMSLAGFLFMIPEAIGNSLFAEQSADEHNAHVHIKKTSKAFVLILIPAIAVTMLFGNYILMFYGKEYSDEGFRLLQILALSAIPVAINEVFGSVFKVAHRMKEVIIINAITGATIIICSFLLITRSFSGIGWTWFLSQAITSVAYGIAYWKGKRIS